MSFDKDSYPYRAPITEGDIEYTRNGHQSQKGALQAAITQLAELRANKVKLGPDGVSSDPPMYAPLRTLHSTPYATLHSVLYTAVRTDATNKSTTGGDLRS
eukprot:7054002-Pyramimonas_sp.AAC.1